jgi:hypothetical protein
MRSSVAIESSSQTTKKFPKGAALTRALNFVPSAHRGADLALHPDLPSRRKCTLACGSQKPELQKNEGRPPACRFWIPSASKPAPSPASRVRHPAIQRLSFGWCGRVCHPPPFFRALVVDATKSTRRKEPTTSSNQPVAATIRRKAQRRATVVSSMTLPSGINPGRSMPILRFPNRGDRYPIRSALCGHRDVSCHLKPIRNPITLGESLAGPDRSWRRLGDPSWFVMLCCLSVLSHFTSC